MPLLSLLFLFFVLFLFSAWSIPSHLKKQNSLSVLFPLLLILTQGDRGGCGGKRQSLYITTKIIPSPWHVQQLQREFDIWGNWVANVILIYLDIGTEGMGCSKGTAGVRMSQGFQGGNILQVKEKWFTNGSGRTESKMPEAASWGPRPCL